MQGVRNAESGAGFTAAVVQVLTGAMRPLNVRRLVSLGVEQGLFGDAEAAESDVRRLVAEGLPRGVREVRPGVLSWSDADVVTETSEPAEAAEDDDPRSGRRRRRRMVDLLGSGPAAAPVSLDEAVLAVEAATDDPDAAHARLWAGLRARAAALVGAMPEDRPRVAQPRRDAKPLAPAPVSEKSTPRPAEPPAPPAASAAERAPNGAAGPASVDAGGSDGASGEALKSRLKARLKARLTVGGERPALPEPGDVARLEDAPYVERRAAPVAPVEPMPEERRAPSLPELHAHGVASDAIRLLDSRRSPISLSELAVGLDFDDSLASLRTLLLAENARQSQSGLRPPFTWTAQGDVGLSAWGLAPRYLALEASLASTLAEMREIAQRDLLARVAQSADEVFERVVLEVLSRAGLEDLATVHRQSGGTLALLGCYRALGDAPTAVLARRSGSVIGVATLDALRGALADFGATHGVVLTCGTFDEAARRSATQVDRGPLTLVDGQGFARMLFTHGVGTTSHSPLVRVPDATFFDAP